MLGLMGFRVTETYQLGFLGWIGIFGLVAALSWKNSNQYRQYEKEKIDILVMISAYRKTMESIEGYLNQGMTKLTVINSMLEIVLNIKKAIMKSNTIGWWEKRKLLKQVELEGDKAMSMIMKHKGDKKCYESIDTK